MNEPPTAGEKLAPSSPDSRKGRKRQLLPPRKPRRSLIRRLARGIVGGLFGVCLLAVAVAGVGGYVAWERFSADLPDVDGLRNYQPPVMSRVFAGDGRLMAELATERRIFVPYSAMPDLVKQAFVSAEDQNFWTHPGVDPLAITRAAVFDMTHMGQRRPIGASTITQQVAKNMLLDNQVSLARKAREAILAMRIEQNAVEGAHPRALPERDLSRVGRLRRRRGGGDLFQQAAGQAHAAGGGVPGCAAEGAEQLQSRSSSPMRRRLGAIGCWIG